MAAAKADVVVVVSSNSTVIALSKVQVADIFLGKSNRFPDGAPATPVDQPEASTARETFYTAIAGKSAAQMKAHWAKVIFTGRGQPPRIAADGVEVKKLLTANISAIAYIDASEVDSSVRVVPTP